MKIGRGHGEVICPGCGLVVRSEDAGLDERYNASLACRQVCDQLTAITLSLRDPDFPHQVAVDAYAAQHGGPQVKLISTAFALIGLYLHFERGFSGRQVQLKHIRLGREKREWPKFALPPGTWDLTIKDAVSGLTPENCRERIDIWARSVWQRWKVEEGAIAMLLPKG